MKCPVCNFENSDNAKFCQECGSKLEPQLKACTNEECCDYGKCILPPEANFCPRCGHKIERQESSGEGKNTNKATNKKEESDGFINGHEYVDLGLPSGVKWATCNVGADSPEGYGDYFAWGETETPKDDCYSEENCGLYEIEIGQICGDPEYDVATSKWGKGWRMPLPFEFDELIDKCEWKWMRKNRVWGMHITGPNGNNIFLPAADSRSGRLTSYPGEEGRYWSSSPGDRKTNDCAHSLVFRKNNIYSVYWNSSRNKGYTIRPIHNPS